jgi:uncharacterized LabA/DUF88 family protein
VTTEHLHYEHDDVDTSVVEYPSALETTIDITTNQTTTSVEAYREGDISLPECTTSALMPEEDHQDVFASHEVAPPLEIVTFSVPFSHKPYASSEEPLVPAGGDDPTSCTSKQEQLDQGTTTIPETPPILEIQEIPVSDKAEEIRPFTDFIEEFRLAEAVRLQTTLQESQVESFTLLSSVESVFAASSPIPDTTDHSEEVSNSVVLSEENASIPSASTNEMSTSSLQTDENGLATPTLSGERVVSPLLRPAPRLRVPRHGTSRYHREEQASVAEETPAVAQPESPEQTIASEPPAVTPPPKPARRYRFDRRGSTTIGANGAYGLNGSTPVIPPTLASGQRPDEEARSSVVPTVDLEAIGEQTAPEMQSTGQLTYKPTATQETVSAENTGSTTTSSLEQGRRRHGQKEQPTIPTNLVDTMASAESASTVEPAMQSAETVLEDLPPLEYSELQKNHSRRRRRHRSGSNSNTPASSAPSKPSAAPVVPPTPQQSSTLMPQIPLTPPVQPSASTIPAYSIVSGYTMSQMNQGNDGSGPFLGPEPSPARGSGLNRDGRTTTRSGAQRVSASSPTPTSRAGDNGLTSSTINQFANIVSQAIETQTDRMVAEFRRLSQAPTNVSVSLPPFPSSERVGVFVDVANLLYSARTLRVAVDFGKLLDFLRGNRRLVRAHAYCPTSPQPGDEQMFLQAVKGLGYRITTKNYKTFSSGAKKADLDLDLCMDVVRLVDGKAVDCIVLLSGDSDFMPMLDYCSDHGVRVEVAAFDEAMSATLRQSCDLFINLSMLEEIRA